MKIQPTKKQLEMIAEICSFYDQPLHARMVINEALEKDHEHLRSEFGTERFLKEQRKMHELRVAGGGCHSINLLKHALDLLPDMRKSGAGSSVSGFNFLRWQEKDGGFQ